MTTQQAKSYKFYDVPTISLSEGDIIKFGCKYEGTTIARVKGLRKVKHPGCGVEVRIDIDALWSTQGDNWFVKRSNEQGDCCIYKRKYSKRGPFGRMLKAH